MCASRPPGPCRWTTSTQSARGNVSPKGLPSIQRRKQGAFARSQERFANRPCVWITATAVGAVRESPLCQTRSVPPSLNSLITRVGLNHHGPRSQSRSRTRSDRRHHDHRPEIRPPKDDRDVVLQVTRPVLPERFTRHAGLASESHRKSQDEVPPERVHQQDTRRNRQSHQGCGPEKNDHLRIRPVSRRVTNIPRVRPGCMGRIQPADRVDIRRLTNPNSVWRTRYAAMATNPPREVTLVIAIRPIPVRLRIFQRNTVDTPAP